MSTDKGNQFAPRFTDAVREAHDRGLLTGSSAIRVSAEDLYARALREGPLEPAILGAGAGLYSPPKPGRYLERLSSEERKRHPMYSGLKAYFPDALAMVSFVSWVGNEKHNPGEPLHHARGKSMDHQDCIERHTTTADEVEEVTLPSGETVRIPHRANVAWRALASLQQWMEQQYELDLAPGAKE